MTFDRDKHHRRSIRLKEYDYSQSGAYFITICTRNKESLFGDISNGSMKLNDFGEIVNKCWDDLPKHYPHAELDTLVIMPNHIHGIIMLHDDVGAGFKPAPTRKRHGLPEIVRAFKTFSSRHINQIRDTTGTPIWQRNYYEHVIRDETSLNDIRQYITNNPVNWAEDKENPINVKV